MKNPSGTIYPKSPLVDVTCELRFDGNLSVECNLDKFQQEVKKDYPLLLVPPTRLERPFKLEPYNFSDKNREKGILLSINYFAYYERKYSGHKKFIEEIEKYIPILKKLFGISKINRLSWRYSNLIEFQSNQDTTVPIGKFLNIKLNTPLGMCDEFHHFYFNFSSKLEHGILTTDIQPALNNLENKKFISLVYDYLMVENLNLDNILSKINTAHEESRNFFEEMITDEYRNFISK